MIIVRGNPYRDVFSKGWTLAASITSKSLRVRFDLTIPNSDLTHLEKPRRLNAKIDLGLKNLAQILRFSQHDGCFLAGFHGGFVREVRSILLYQDTFCAFTEFSLVKRFSSAIPGHGLVIRHSILVRHSPVQAWVPAQICVGVQPTATPCSFRVMRFFFR